VGALGARLEVMFPGVATRVSDVTFRDFGAGLAKALPFLEPAARAIYRAMPPWLHDTPTSRVRSFFEGAFEVTFIQIGAFDGKAGDPIGELILERRNWKGIMIEPQRGAFERLKENYKEEASRLMFINCAISRSSGHERLFTVPESQIRLHDLPGWSREIASFDPDHLKNHFPQVEAQVETVETMTFEEAAALASMGRVDLIVMDVEGHEQAILETIDIERFGVRFIVYEHKHLSIAGRRFLGTLLSDHGFVSKEFGRDTIAWR
jgi:FkbM family methyltransferase